MSNRDDRDASLDLELSALIDHELDAASEADWRRRLEREPEWAERLAELERVDRALRALPVRPASDAIGRRLRARIEAQSSPRARAPTRRGARRRAAIGAGLALAAAASVALVWLGTRRVQDAAPWKSASDEDLEIALDLPVLDDYDVLEHLDLLEALQEMDQPGRS